MAKENAVKGFVTEALPNVLFRVQLEDETEVLAHISGKMKHHKIKVLVGDTVMVVLDPYKGKTTNRIVERCKPTL